MLGTSRALALAAALVPAACGETETAGTIAPQALTRAAIGYYCNMIVADHVGPKAQIFLAGRAEPLWFSSVRDAVAFTLLPEEPKSLSAIYVNDMGRASWDAPEPGTWIEAHDAVFVIGSSRRGGMGALEAVPFAQRTAAEPFAREHGGHIVSFAEIPRDYILNADDDGGHDAVSQNSDEAANASHSH